MAANRKISSIKLRITLWYAVFLLLIIVLMLGTMLISQHFSSHDFYQDRLSAAISEAAASVHTMEDALNLSPLTDSAVYISVLDGKGEMISGIRSFSVAPKEEAIRIRQGKHANAWYILDKPVTLQDGGMLWLRCFISTAVSESSNRSLMLSLALIVPVILVIVLFGGLLLTRRAFQPLDSIIDIAQNISTSTDLKQRFRHPEQSSEVGRLADAFDAMFARLEQSLESEKAFVSHASHELRTPLTVIRAQSEFALDPKRTLKEKDAALQTILIRSKKAGDMLSQMLLLSRMDYQKLPLSLERIHLSELLDCLILEMQLKAGRRGISISGDLQRNVFLICDELLIMRMLTNLLENALQYGRENGHVWLKLSHSEGRLRISIRDDGIGISAEDQQRIWKRFYQADKSAGKNVGAGLGLPIVQWIARAHGGSAQVQSIPGEGAEFTIDLPDEKHSPLQPG